MNDYEFYGKAIDRLDDIRDGQIGLRDYFAAKAMQGLIATDCYGSAQSVCAKDAYGFADAMLAAREQTP